MPRCQSCNPICQKCHRKPNFILPQKCPVCGRYNPAHWKTCPKCGTAIMLPETKDLITHLSAETKKNCFQCDPLKNPLCGTCLKLGRTKKCPSCNSINLGTRADCKYCGSPLQK